MEINWNDGTFTLYDKSYGVKSFKEWFTKNYQPLIPRYYVGNGRYDWKSIFSDCNNNGIMEIYKIEKHD